MNGPTPPHTYNLQMRKKRFHGVEAIRMLPVDGRNRPAATASSPIATCCAADERNRTAVSPSRITTASSPPSNRARSGNSSSCRAVDGQHACCLQRQEDLTGPPPPDAGSPHGPRGRAQSRQCCCQGLRGPQRSGLVLHQDNGWLGRAMPSPYTGIHAIHCWRRLAPLLNSQISRASNSAKRRALSRVEIR